MQQTTPETAWRAFLYGGASMLLAFDLFFLVKALITGDYVPIVPIIAGILTAGGLLAIVYAEHQARLEEKRDHRRISRVAHQLEMPLSSLDSDLKYLTTNADKLPGEARTKIKKMETKTNVLIENIRDLFLMLQAQEHPIAGEVRTYDICRLLQDATESHMASAKAHNVELIHRFHCETAPVKIDKGLMRIVLNHLIENAITYTNKPGLVNIAVTRNQKQIRIIVQDRGIGINDTDAEAIFRPFARGNRASEFDPDGIGVGLTLSRLIVREFGGQLIYQRQAKKSGTQFEVVLPLAK